MFRTERYGQVLNFGEYFIENLLASKAEVHNANYRINNHAANAPMIDHIMHSK